MLLRRSQTLLAALWGGLLLCVAVVAAPSAFAVLERAQAGLVVARLFALEANVSMAAALLLILIERRLNSAALNSAALSANVLLPAGALFCTVAGYFALQPMMAAAKMGQGNLSFLTLHAISFGFYGLKTVLVLVLAWRTSKTAV